MCTYSENNDFTCCEDKENGCSEPTKSQTSDKEDLFGHIIVHIEILKIEDEESREIPKFYYLSLNNAEVLECEVKDRELLLNEAYDGDMLTEVSNSIGDALRKHLEINWQRGERVASKAPFSRREERVAYELHCAVAKKLIDNPKYILSLVPDNIKKIRQNVRGPFVARWLDEWERLARGPIGNLIQVMLREDNEAIEMRQNSPFAGALTQAERLEAIARAQND